MTPIHVRARAARRARALVMIERTGLVLGADPADVDRQIESVLATYRRADFGGLSDPAREAEEAAAVCRAVYALVTEQEAAVTVRLDRPTRNKFGARVIVVDGRRFDSRREATRYAELVILTRAGMIRDLECHPKFSIDVVELFRRGDPSGPWHLVRCGTYTADFRYVDRATGEVIIEDVKSGPTRTTAYRLRKRLVEAIHGVAIREVA